MNWDTPKSSAYLDSDPSELLSNSGITEVCFFLHTIILDVINSITDTAFLKSVALLSPDFLPNTGVYIFLILSKCLNERFLDNNQNYFFLN